MVLYPNKLPESERVCSGICNEDAFSFYDTDKKNFVIEKGDFEILVGPSSSELPLKGIINL